MSLTILEQILLSEENIKQAEKQFLEAKALEEKLRQRRNDGTLLYEGWRGSQDYRQWRTSQLELQKWQCAYCGKLMKLGKITYLSNDNFILEPDHPTVEHILPKSFFPELALDKQNLLMVCSDCNKRKSNNMAKASRSRYEQLKLKLKR